MTTELGHVVMISINAAALITPQNSRVLFNDLAHYIIHIFRFVETEDLEGEVAAMEHRLKLVSNSLYVVRARVESPDHVSVCGVDYVHPFCEFLSVRSERGPVLRCAHEDYPDGA